MTWRKQPATLHSCLRLYVKSLSAAASALAATWQRLMRIKLALMAEDMAASKVAHQTSGSGRLISVCGGMMVSIVIIMGVTEKRQAKKVTQPSCMVSLSKRWRGGRRHGGRNK